jgi:two-component system, NarL family, nitrate/nitrite response regulator NarL
MNPGHASNRSRGAKRAARVTVAIIGQTRHYRESLSHVLMARRQFVVADAGDGGPASVDRAAHLRPDVVLLDLRETTTRSLLEELRRALPAAALIAINAEEDEDQIVRLLEFGLTGFVSKEGSVEEIHSAIEGTLRGDLHCPARITAALVRRLRKGAGRNIPVGNRHGLSSRELDVIGLVEQGLTNKEIARHLQIEAATVKNHVHHILTKLSVHRRGEAVQRLFACP